MSQEAPLAEAAPVGSEVATPAAPAVPEVVAGSGETTTGAAPAPAEDALKQKYEERINGLMSSFNKLQSEHEALKRSQLPPEERVAAEKEELESRLESLQGEFALLEVDKAIDEVVRENPLLGEFRDLIVADSVDEVYELAQHLNERLSRVVPGSPTPATPATPEVTAPVVAGSPAAGTLTPEALGEAMDKARKTGDWGDYIRLKESVR